MKGIAEHEVDMKGKAIQILAGIACHSFRHLKMLIFPGVLHLALHALSILIVAFRGMLDHYMLDMHDIEDL